MQKLSDRSLNDFNEDHPETNFWTDGIKVFNQKTLLRGANPKTFIYDGIFAKDDRKCFCGENWLKDADVDTFEPLNYTYAIDKNNVYTITGKVKDADIATFKVLDDGKSLLGYNRIGIPEYTFYSYVKDKNNVYYHNYEGKPKVIKNADGDTFISLYDGYFAKDKNYVYGNGKIIKNADVKSWDTLSEIPNSYYSKDSKRIFYGFWEIKADYETFELEIPEKAKSVEYQLAKDKDNFYRNGEIISKEDFEKYSSKADR
ncbi:DKNYY domain-containing protein [Chryseobacterium sp. SSA4.19]|uniref:DKNYY domain-containing protein n=1 Tax=Chryseobacterium sp. SSA4.19 TaxID=2919915 RepID=UPI001F4E1E2D|nr:DKNYY domain-containing protein [Chryseobacterium sp. SSA4.19]MCJ8155539.1 DKNYY domain-containing protein [Chryseobacterium sp. SSA4.19]